MRHTPNPRAFGTADRCRSSNQQSNQQNAMSCATSVFLGSSRGLVSRCNIYSCQIHTVEVTGSNPVAPTTVLRDFIEIPKTR